MTPDSEIDKPTREQIREIWRPLYDMGYKGNEQIDAHGMALLISAAVDETEQLILSSNKRAVEKELELLTKAVINHSGEPAPFNPGGLPISTPATEELTKLLQNYASNRLASLGDKV